MEWIQTLIGGIGGAVITVTAGWFIARQGKKRVFFHKEMQQFALPPILTEIEGAQHPLKVSLGGETFDHLTKSTFQISNIGRVSIPSFDLVVHLPLASRLLSVGSTIKPLAAEVSHLSENLADFQQHSFSIPLLEAGDIAEVSMLYDGEHHTMALLRKTDGIQIVLQKAQGFTPPAVELISLAVVLLLFGGVIYMVLSNSLQARLYGLGAAVAAGTIILALIERASSRGRKGQTSE